MIVFDIILQLIIEILIYYRELVKLLVEVGGANVNVQDQMGRTPSRRAKEICKMDIMKFLEEQ